MTPRKVLVMPPRIEPENAARMTAPPPITNQVDTSWLLTTSPRSSASSRRFCVGSSVRSASSWSSAIVASQARRHHAQDAFDIVEECHHHGPEHQHQDQEADKDR